jgi:hypothetical protein
MNMCYIQCYSNIHHFINETYSSSGTVQIHNDLLPSIQRIKRKKRRYLNVRYVSDIGVLMHGSSHFSEQEVSFSRVKLNIIAI